MLEASEPDAAASDAVDGKQVSVGSQDGDGASAMPVRRRGCSPPAPL